MFLWGVLMLAFIRRLLLILLSLAVLPSAVVANERLEGIACRSVHLGYAGKESVAFYNEIAVDNSAPGTYFAVCGWDKGYYGMQELGNGKKLLIFSVWDSGQNDPKAVAEKQRVILVHKDEKVRVGRFGGEGTGGQSFFDYDWKPGQTYRFLVLAKPKEERTEYSGYFYVPEDKAWKHLVTFSTITGGKPLRGYYSFVEDFKRDKVSTTKVRKAHFGNAWLKNAAGEWSPIGGARFTADANPVLNIDAGTDAGRFFLTTGGDTKNTNTRLNATIPLPERKDAKPPSDLPTATAPKPKD
jgi:hypothetical protein